MPFDARAVAAETSTRYPPFEFVDLDGVEHTLPHPLTLLERDVDQFNTDPKSWLAAHHPAVADAIADMPVAVSRSLLEAWMSTQGNPGKSPGASSPAPTAAKR